MANRYSQIIERVFLMRYRKRAREIAFVRDDIVAVAREIPGACSQSDQEGTRSIQTQS